MIISENVFILSILIIIGLGILVYYFHKKLDKISSTSLEGFKSEGQIINYFKETKQLILKEKWLLLLPLTIYLVQYLLNSIFFIYNVIVTYGFEFLFNMKAINSVEKSRTIFRFKSILNYINDLVSIPVNFSFIYYGKLIYNIFFIFGAFVFVILFKLFIKKMQKYIEKGNEEKINFLRRTLKYTLVFGLIVLGVKLFSIIAGNRISSTNGSIRFFHSLVVIINLVAIILFSFLQGIILFTIKEGSSKKLYDLDFKIKKSLGSFKHLLKFNLILFLILNIRMIILLIPILRNQIFSSLSWLEYVFILINLVLVLSTMFTPHIIVFENKNVIKGLKGSIEFITFNFSRYMLLIMLLVIIEFVFKGLLRSIDLSFYGYIYTHILNGIFGFLTVVFRVGFPIVLTKFYFDYKNYKEMI